MLGKWGNNLGGRYHHNIVKNENGPPEPLSKNSVTEWIIEQYANSEPRMRTWSGDVNSGS